MEKLGYIWLYFVTKFVGVSTKQDMEKAVFSRCDIWGVINVKLLQKSLPLEGKVVFAKQKSDEV